MAMFPNATRGYMPFVSGQNRRVVTKKSGKPVKNDKRKRGVKTYQVTLKDRSGRTYTYIVRSDGTKSMPVLCDSLINSLGCTASLPNLGLTSPVQKMLYSRDDLDCKDDGTKKENIFSAFFRFLKEKTTKSKSGKSKRKQKPQVQRKRQRTISALSNLDPIQESPDEDDYVDEDDDNDSYTHDSSSLSESETSGENDSICDAETKLSESQVTSQKET